MAENKKGKKSTVKEISKRAIGATLKAVLIYVLYLLVAPFLSPLLGIIPGFMESIELFIMIYVVLVILGDLTKGSIFQFFFGTARSLFLMAYLLFTMGDGVFNGNIENLSLSVNLTLFYTIAIMLSLIGFARSIMQAINFMIKRAESKGNLQV